ncbi:MAG: carboxypeptidase-like regulatory domain-containing protein [Longimicrobiales bacterium]|nr:carboxypeptidase-like regulatory domain-containing protein [Longimicrobiales bacterium]
MTSRALPVFAPAVAALLASAPLTAQTVVGRVLDDTRESPVAGALVRLLDRDGKERVRALADSAGRFVLAPPKAGEYYLEATSLGYQRTLSPLLAFAQGQGTAALELMMIPAPIGLEGLSVEVDVEGRAAQDLALSGIRPRDLGNRWISRKDIDAVEIRPDVGRVLEWQNIANLRVIRPESQVPGSDPMGLCVSLVRARTGSGAGRCALVVLNGVPITGEAALSMDPEAVGGMALLLPTEATLLFGVRGEAGALLLWTRSGEAR